MPPLAELKSLTRRVPATPVERSARFPHVVDSIGRWSVRLVIGIGMAAMLIALVLHFQLVVGLLATAIVLAMVGCTAFLRS